MSMKEASDEVLVRTALEGEVRSSFGGKDEYNGVRLQSIASLQVLRKTKKG